MNTQEYLGEKIDYVADSLFIEKRNKIKEKIEECIRELGDYVDHRATTSKLCKQLGEVLEATLVKDIPATNSHIQKLFYDQAWNIVKNQGTH